MKPFGSFGKQDVRRTEEFAAAGLCAEPRTLGIARVYRYAQTGRKCALERRRVEARQMSGCSVADRGPHPLNETRARQQLRRQRSNRRIVTAEQLQSSASVASGDPCEQMQVIVDDGGLDRLARQLDDAGAR